MEILFFLLLVVTDFGKSLTVFWLSVAWFYFRYPTISSLSPFFLSIPYSLVFLLFKLVFALVFLGRKMLHMILFCEKKNPSFRSLYCPPTVAVTDISAKELTVIQVFVVHAIHPRSHADHIAQGDVARNISGSLHGPMMKPLRSSRQQNKIHEQTLLSNDTQI